MLDAAAISIGNFDGVHAGHRALINELCHQASKHGIPPAVVSFDPHPIEVLHPQVTLPKLNTLSRKAELLGSCGVEFLVVLPTNPQLLELTYQQFFAEYIQEKLRAKVIVEGPNFLFGKDRLGSTKELSQLCQQNSVTLKIVEIEADGAQIISSSVIRDLLQAGKVEQANELLKDRYQVSGRVGHGAARGRKLGFPTANLEQVDCLIPRDGVYAGVALLDGQVVACAINVGSNPTFGDEQRKVEVHLLDQDQDLYGQKLTIEFLYRIRDLTKFTSQEQLVSQIADDIAAIRVKTLDFIR